MLLLETLERQTQTAVLVAATMRAAGADTDIPDWGALRAEFDATLAASPVPATPEDADRLVMLQALGLR